MRSSTQQIRGGMICPRAFTLVEVIMAMVSVSVLVAGLMSCLLLAGHILDEDAIIPAQEMRGRDGLDRITTDLQYVTAFTERTAHSVTCRVPDQDSDDQPETLRYTWSGIAGDPLMMAYNGSDAVPLIRDVHQFDLTYDTRVMTGTGFAKGEITSVENQSFVVFHETGNGTSKAFYIKSGDSVSFFFKPDLPAGTDQWKITELRLYAKKDAVQNGVMAVQIRPGTEGVGPSETVLHEFLIDEKDLAMDFTWQIFTLNVDVDTPVEQGLFVVIEHVSGPAGVGAFEFEEDIPDEPDKQLFVGWGGPWQLWPGEMVFYVLGESR